MKIKDIFRLQRFSGLVLIAFGLSFYFSLGVNTLVFLLWLIFTIGATNWGEFTSLLKNSYVRLSAILLFSWYLMSVLWSEHSEIAWSEVISKLSLLLIPLFFGQPQIETKQYKQVLKSFAFGSVGVILYAITAAGLDFYLVNNALSLMDAISYENLANHVHFQPIYLSLYVMSAFFIILWDLFDARLKWYDTMSLILLFVAMILLSSRTETLIFIFLLLSILVIWGYRIGRLKTMLLISFSLLVIMLGIIFASPTARTRFVEMFDTKTHYSQNQYGGRGLRIEKWKNTLECWQDYKWIGTGVGDYKLTLENTYRKNGFEVGYVNHYNSHNQYLQTLLATGVVGLLLLVAYLFFALKQAYQERNFLAVVFIVAFALSCLTESMLERQKGLVFFVFMVHFLLSKPRPNS